MANSEHLAVLHQGVSHWNNWWKSQPRTIPDLSGADLSNQDFTNIILSKTNLQGANLSHTRLTNAHLNGANLSQASLKDANLDNAHCFWTSFATSDLSGASLKQTQLYRADLRYANLSQANLLQASLKEADLSYADLTQANLSQSDLHHANFSHSYLLDTNFLAATVAWAIFQSVDLLQTQNMETTQRLHQAIISDNTLFDPSIVPLHLLQAPQEPRYQIDIVSPHHLQISFGCQYPDCEHLAFSLTLVTDASYLSSPQTLAQVSQRFLGPDIEIKSLLPLLFPSEQSINQLEVAAQIELALRQGDAASLQELSPTLMALYCMRCDATYCLHHWELNIAYEGGHPEYLTGFCPYGHSLFLEKVQ